MKVTQPKGTQDFLPAAARLRRQVTQRIADIFERYGFEPLETPAFEHLETLTGKYGEEGERLIFKILKRGEEGRTGDADLALRYDLTVPLARVVAQYSELPRPFKRYQIAPVWRAEKPQRGRFREFVQCDVDVAGSSSLLVEIELLTLAHQLYGALGFKDFVIELNHRQMLSTFMGLIGATPEQSVSFLITLDKLDKVGPAGVLAELATKGATLEQQSWLERLIQLVQDSADDPNATMRRMAALRDIVSATSAGRDAFDDLMTILTGLKAAGVPDERVRFNPVLARGLGYYTGAIFEVVLPGFGSSIGGGGRYDGLVGMFSNRKVPACGISFGLERILLLMQEAGLLAGDTSGAQVLVANYDDAGQAGMLSLAQALRAAGLRVDVFPESGKLGQQMQYGTARQIPFAAIVGPDEREKGLVTLRNLNTRAQEQVPVEEAAARLLVLLSPTAA